MGRLRGWPDAFRAVGDVRGLGLMIGIEFMRGGQPATGRRAAACSDAASSDDLLVLTCGIDDNVIRLLPPLTIDEAELDRGLDILEQCVARGWRDDRERDGGASTANLIGGERRDGGERAHLRVAQPRAPEPRWSASSRRAPPPTSTPPWRPRSARCPGWRATPWPRRGEIILRRRPRSWSSARRSWPA